MEISDRVRTGELRAFAEQASSLEDVKRLLIALTDRVDLMYQDLCIQLKGQPTIYTVDPEDPANAEKVEGAKAGDIAVYVKDGAVRIYVFN
ncbi:MAG: hypothetical protein QXT73_01320 [Candidatus Methanomethylicaceae archaeon]